MEKIIWED